MANNCNEENLLGDEDNNICIIGSGLIGTSFAVIFAKSEFNVTLYDISEEQLKQVKNNARLNLVALIENNLLNITNNEEETISNILSKIKTSTNLEESLKDCFFVHECVPEKFELKKQIFEKVDPLLNPNAIFASSTSNIPSSRFTSNLEHKHRTLVCHPVNPPFAIPLIEIIPSEYTTDDIKNKAFQLFQKVKMEPIIVKKEIDGFCLNRLQYALLAEAYRLVEDGICSATDVDKCIKFGLARRWAFMGPFQTIDLNAPNGISDYCERYTDGILNVVKKQDNTREWTKETIDTIESDIRENVQQQDELQERTIWRNKRLLALEAHMQQQPN